MKLLLLLVFAALLSSACNKNLNSGKKTSYFFCKSRTINLQEDTSIIYILYTDVYCIDTDERSLREKTNKWASLVDKICKSPLGCTSDLNYYHSKQEAEVIRNELFDRYKDPEKYKMEKVEFN